MQTKCFHCGLDVPPQSTYHTVVQGKQHAFCCPGCCAVADAIVQNGLEDYYQYRSEYATKASPQEDPLLQQLQVFDDDNFLAEFVNSNEQSNEIQLTISGIHCSACGWLIEKQLAKLNGILKVAVNVTASRAIITWDSQQLKLSQILTQIEKIGYHAKPFHKGSYETSENSWYGLYAWIEQNNLELRDEPSFEKYLNSSDEVKASDLRTEIHVPIV